MSTRHLYYNSRRGSCASQVADLCLQRDAAAVHRFGECALYELLREVGARTGTMTTIDQVAAHYARLDPDLLHLFGPDRFPASVWEVPI